jgi:hypothetical protein
VTLAAQRRPSRGRAPRPHHPRRGPSGADEQPVPAEDASGTVAAESADAVLLSHRHATAVDVLGVPTEPAAVGADRDSFLCFLPGRFFLNLIAHGI